MPVLTIEDIRNNPWNVLTHQLPEKPDTLLLEIARVAAEYCRLSEAMLTDAVRDGLYLPPGWEPTEDWPDAHEITEGRMLDADEKCREIEALLENALDDTDEDNDAE
jgi:hypothetical protein